MFTLLWIKNTLLGYMIDKFCDRKRLLILLIIYDQNKKRGLIFGPFAALLLGVVTSSFVKSSPDKLQDEDTTLARFRRT